MLWPNQAARRQGTKPLAMTNLVVVKATPSADISTDKTMAAGSETARSCQSHPARQPASPRWKWLKPSARRSLRCFCASLARAVWVLSTLPTIKAPDRKVALKIIHPERQQDQATRPRHSGKPSPCAGVLNVIHVYQVGEVEGQLFIAMEFVNGTTLSKWQSDPAHKWQDILRMYIAAGQRSAIRPRSRPGPSRF